RIDFLDAVAFDETRRGVLTRLTYRLAPTWDLRAFADVARSECPAIDLRTEDRRYGLGIGKTWSRHWSSALDYVHYQRDSARPSGDSRQNVWYLTVTYRNPRPRRRHLTACRLQRQLQSPPSRRPRRGTTTH